MSTTWNRPHLEHRQPRNSSHATHTRHGPNLPIYSEWTKYPPGLRMLPVGPHGKVCIIRQLLPVPPHATSLPGLCRCTTWSLHARVSNRHNRRGTSTTGKQPPQPTRITKATLPPGQVDTLAPNTGATHTSHNFAKRIPPHNGLSPIHHGDRTKNTFN